MSLDLNPVPGLPLLTTLYCNSTTVKKKTTVTCSFPDALYTKKSFYGGPIGAGVGFFEIVLVVVFILLSFKMKHDVTKAFLTIVYIPLGLSSVFKVATGVYGTLMGAYGWFYMVFLMFFNWLYTTAVLATAIGSVIYLSALIVVARKRQNFKNCDSWTTYFATLFFSVLLSGSYHFCTYQWNQMPAAAIFFTYALSNVGIVVQLLVCLCVGLLCKSKPANSTEVIVLTGDPVVDDARSRLGWGAFAVIVMNIPQWFEIYAKTEELFTPYLWESDDAKTVFYRAQAIELLTFDTIRLFLSFFMLLSLFVTISGRFSLELLINRKPHPLANKTAATATAAQNKVFVATQSQPLLMDTGEKKKEPAHHHEKKTHAIAATTAPIVQQAMPLPNQVPVVSQPVVTQPVAQPAAQPIPPPAAQPIQAPPQYPGIGFAPGMLQLPHNMQTTIVYTPAMAYENLNGQVTAEKLK